MGISIPRSHGESAANSWSWIYIGVKALRPAVHVGEDFAGLQRFGRGGEALQRAQLYKRRLPVGEKIRSTAKPAGKPQKPGKRAARSPAASAFLSVL